MIGTEEGEVISVLLAETDQDAFIHIQSLLQTVPQSPYAIVPADSRERVRNELRERRFDIALIGENLADGNGLDLIAEAAPLYPQCPMILLSERAVPELDLAAEQNGAAGYLVSSELTAGLLHRSIRYARQAARKQAAIGSILHDAPAGLIGFDVHGTPVLWNTRALDALLLPPAAASHLPSLIVEALRRAGSDVVGRTEHIRDDGKAFDIDFARASDGRAVAVIHDVTERSSIAGQLRRISDQAVRDCEAKSGLLANMSHELRTPLNGILGMIRMLEGSPLDETQRDATAVIRASGASLLKIIDEVLDLSKIEAGRMQLETIDMPIAETIDDVVRLMAPAAFEKGVELTAFVSPLAPPTMRGDPLRMRQVLTNLVGNAVKFTNSGTIRVVAEQIDDAGRPSLSFSVIDTGVGIPAGELNSIFERYRQVDASISRKFGGTGLGLALCRDLIDLMGGTISCSSREGCGSALVVKLPLSGEPAALVGADRANRQHRGTRILAASPSPGILDTIEQYGQAVGAIVTTAASGDRLREAIGEASFDLMLLDGAFGTTETAALLDMAMPRNKLMLLEGTPGQARTLRMPDDRVLARPFLRHTFDRLLQRLDLPGEPADAAPADSTGRKLRILMAEDNSANQRVAAALLRAAGFRVEIVGNGQAAVDRATAAKFDLILMDVQMPVMDGLTATRKLREMDRVRLVPIIGLTAGVSSEDRNACMIAGMSDYISKPIDWDKLLALLDRLDDQIYGASRFGSTAAA